MQHQPDPNLSDWFEAIYPGIEPRSMYVSKEGLIQDTRGIHPPEYLSSNGLVYTFTHFTDGRFVLIPFSFIMAYTFLPIPTNLSNKPIIPRHKNGIPTDCRLENLEWVEDVEEWRTVEFHGKELPMYRISNHGRIQSQSLHFNSQWRDMSMITVQNRGNYKRVMLVVSTGCRSNAFIHRLVAAAFCPGHTQERNTVNHIDNVHDNNNWWNLEWVTNRENSDHAIAIGVSGLRGDQSPRAKISEADAIKICHALNRHHGCAIDVFNELKHEIPSLTYPIVTSIKYGDTFSYLSQSILTPDGKRKQERQTDPDVILEAAMLLKKYNGDVAKTKKEFQIKYPWVSLGWLWHLKDKSVAAEITDQVFTKDEFPKTVPLTEETVMMIIQSLLRHKNDQYPTNEAFVELKDQIPGLTRDKVRSIKDKKAWKELSDKFFTKDDFRG